MDPFTAAFLAGLASGFSAGFVVGFIVQTVRWAAWRNNILPAQRIEPGRYTVDEYGNAVPDEWPAPPPPRVPLLHNGTPGALVTFPAHHGPQTKTVELESDPVPCADPYWPMAVEASLAFTVSEDDPGVFVNAILDFVGVAGSDHNYLYDEQLIKRGWRDLSLREGPPLKEGDVIQARMTIRCETPNAAPFTVEARATVAGRKASR